MTKWLDELMYEKIRIGIRLDASAIKELHHNRYSKIFSKLYEILGK